MSTRYADERAVKVTLAHTPAEIASELGDSVISADLVISFDGITLGDLRRARAALAQAPGGEGGIDPRKVLAEACGWHPDAIRPEMDNKFNTASITPLAAIAAMRAYAAALSTPAPDAGQVEAELIESIAQWLHDETDHPEAFTQRTWPTHPNDTGQREGGWVKIVPVDVQARFREIAKRLVTGFHLSASPARAEDEGLLEALNLAVERECDRAVHQALRNQASGERGPNGELFETCFRFVIKQVLAGRAAPPHTAPDAGMENEKPG